jgi:hypothetical protein
MFLLLFESLWPVSQAPNIDFPYGASIAACPAQIDARISLPIVAAVTVT